MEMRQHTLFLEVVASLKAGTEAIKGLAGLADPETHSINCSSKRTHFGFFFSESSKRLLIGLDFFDFAEEMWDL